MPPGGCAGDAGRGPRPFRKAAPVATVTESPRPAPGLMVVHGNRLEELRALVVEWLRRHPLAPLENETILVQSNGIAQWIKLALARNPGGPEGGCGIAAALDVQLPARFLWWLNTSVRSV